MTQRYIDISFDESCPSNFGGYDNENNATVIRLKTLDEAAQYYIEVEYKSNKYSTPELTPVDGYVTFELSREFTQASYNALYVQGIMKLGDETRKTARVRVNFSRSINAVDSLPESSQSWADDITERVTAVQSTAEEAKLAAEDANAKVGNLDNLKTDAKDNLVAAINEATQSGGGAANAVLYTEQTLTDAEKLQARTNIGAGTGDGIDVSGAVGQIVKIKAVDDAGKPTEWEAVDMPSGGAGETWELLATYDASTSDAFEYTFDAPVKRLMIVSRCVDTAGELYGGSTTVYRWFYVKTGGSWKNLEDIKIGCCSHSWGYSGRIYIICEQDIALILKAEGLSSGTGTCTMGPVYPTGNYTNGNIQGIKIGLQMPDGTENTASGSIKVWGVKA
jgi:hypothetical protein